MNIEQYLEKNANNPDKLRNLKVLYDNWFETGCVLYNAMSDIVSTCGDGSLDIFNKVEKIKDSALTAIDISNEIGLTNPDLFVCENRTENLAKLIKLAKRGAYGVDNRRNSKRLGKNGQCKAKASLV